MSYEDDLPIILAETILNLGSPEDVNSFFKNMKAIDPQLQRAALDEVESIILQEMEELRAVPPSMREEIIENAIETDPYKVKQSLNKAHTMTHIMMHLDWIKGDESAPLIKAAVAEVKKLSPAGFSSCEMIARAMFKAVDREGDYISAPPTPKMLMPGPQPKPPKGPGNFKLKP